MHKILVADDNADLRKQIVEILDAAGYATEEAANGREAVEKVGKGDFDVIVLDSIMPIMRGLEVISEIRKVSPKTKVVIMTAFATIENAVDFIKKGAAHYLPKPFKIDELLTIVRREIEESSFDDGKSSADMDYVLNALANPIRRKIIKILHSSNGMRFMEINRTLAIEDHTKLVFHLRILKEANIISQDDAKTYLLTREGQRVLTSLSILEKHLTTG